MQNQDDSENLKLGENPTITWAEKTDVGRTRTENQDAMGQRDYDNFRLWVVCDGMGGHAGGSMASNLAVTTILDEFAASELEDPRERLEEALHVANDRVYVESTSIQSLRGMGTTAVALLIDTEAPLAYMAHVGDSRGYRARRDRYERVTMDHTMVQFMVDDGILSEEEAAEHPHGNIIARSIGSKKLKTEHQEPLELHDGDLFLLCSDGLSGRVTEPEMADMVWDQDPDEAVVSLVDLANERGGEDNITVQIVLLGERGEKPDEIEVAHATERPAPLKPDEEAAQEGEGLDFKRIQEVLETRDKEIKKLRKKAGRRSLRKRLASLKEPSDDHPAPKHTERSASDGERDLDADATAPAETDRSERAEAVAALPAILLGIVLGLAAFLVVYLVVTKG